MRKLIEMVEFSLMYHPRYKHSVGVMKMAIKLNEIHNLNVSELRILLLEIQKNICSLVKQKNLIKQNILNCSNLSELLDIKIEFKMMDFS